MESGKKNMLRAATLMLSAAAIFSFSGCFGGDAGTNKVVFVSHTEATDYTGKMVDVIKAHLDGQGVELDFQNANRDANLQIDMMNEAIAAKPAAIVLLPVDAQALVQSVEKANEANIPVIVASRDLSGGKFAMVKSDERQAGNLQGEYMAKHLPPNSTVVYLMGESGQSSTEERWLGFKEACLDKRPDIKLLARVDGAWNEAEGFKYMTLWLQLFPKINAVVAANDTMALGALQAVKSSGRLPGTLITGVDAKDAALKAVGAGEMALTVKQDPVKAGEAIDQLLDSALKGNIPTDNIKVPFAAVTRDNLAEFQ